VLLWVKLIETVCQLRPKSLFRLLAHPDRLFRAGMRWYSNIGRRVWTYELRQWLIFDHRTRRGPTLAEFLDTCSVVPVSTRARKPTNLLDMSVGSVIRVWTLKLLKGLPRRTLTSPERP
jgi:hypothetical protein